MDQSLEDTSTRLARIEVKLDIVLSQWTDHEARMRTLEAAGTGDHGERLTALERWRYGLPAATLIALCEGAFIIWKMVNGQ